MDLTIVWLMAIILIEHISLITTSSLSLKYQKCMSEKINGFHLYTGKQDYTKSLYSCERWDATNPRNTFNSRITATNRTHRTFQNNYCRTMYPDEHPVPWCYTRSDLKWEECEIKMCSFDKDEDKYQTCMGEKTDGYHSYTGTISITKSGIPCQRWDAVKPHDVHVKLITLGRTFLSSQHNYCRTMYPDPDDKPWCYTMNSLIRSEECDIPKCYFDKDKDDNTPLLSRFKPYSTRITYEKENYSIIDEKRQTKFKTLKRQLNKWEIDLLQMSKIKHVKISSVDIKTYSIADVRQIHIHIGDEKFDYWEQCTQFNGPGKNISQKHKFICKGIAKNIRVEIFHFGYFRLQDVEVFGYEFGKDLFLLYNKSALFVSTSDNEASSPGVIGYIDTKFKPLLSWRNFWKVNLLKQYNISYLILLGLYTGQHYSDKILKIAVYIENKEQQNSSRCAYFEAPNEESRNNYTFICEGIGQFIRVEKSEFGHFQLQMVKVFGYAYDDIVLLSGNKPVSISPTYDSETTSYRVDGENSLGQNYTWEVNLLRMCKITYILVHTMGDFRMISIYIGGYEHNNWDTCAVFKSSSQNSAKKHRFDCEGIGQYIRVKIFHLGHFKSQDSEVFGIQYDNGLMLLYNKSALFVAVNDHKMSSPGVERSFNTDFKTLLSWKNFWKVDLLKMFKIKYVILHNVYPVTQSANSNLTIAVYLENSKQKYSTRCAYYNGPEDKSRTLYRFICETIGQYIRVEKSHFGRFKLQEIEVYGYTYYDDALLISQRKPTQMSSIYENENSSHGVDGKISTKFKTLPSQYNKWEVNLLRLFKISHLILTNVENDSGGFRNMGVYIAGKEHNNWEKCLYFDNPGEKTRKYYVACEGIAQYIRVDKSYFGAFQLQEVEVFGYTIDDVILLSSNKPTSMGPRVLNDMSVHGVDGDNKTFFKMTNNDNFNYWSVTLFKMLKIKYVTFYLAHTEEYDFSDFQKIYIYVVDEKKESVGVKCAYYDRPGEKSRTIYNIICEAIGNQVRIERFHNGHLKIQEVEVYGINYDAKLISLKKPTHMTHDKFEKQHVSSHGVDGKPNTIFKTASSPFNTWKVNLNRMCKISHVILTNIDNDGNDSDGFRNISVYLGDTNYRNWEKCGYFDGPGENSVKYSTACEGIAHYVRVVKSHSGSFQLQEVEVFGYYIDDIILISTYNKPTTMSSTYENDISSHGVDGKSKTKFKTLYHDHSNYWAVNLSVLWNISYVSLHTVEHEVHHEHFDLRKISIYISNKKEITNERCAYFGGPNDQSRSIYSFSCEGIGQYVRIVKDYKGYLELQEVEVYGKVPF